MSLNKLQRQDENVFNVGYKNENVSKTGYEDKNALKAAFMRTKMLGRKCSQSRL